MTRQRLVLIAIFALLGTAAQAGTTVENIRIWAEGGKTRVVLDLSQPAEHTIFTLRGPDRLVIDLKDGRLSRSLNSDMPDATRAPSSSPQSRPSPLDGCNVFWASCWAFP